MQKISHYIFPVRVSITKIIRKYGHKIWIDKRHRKLSLTFQVIDENLDTLEEYILRKIKWTTKHFIQEGKTPSDSQFQKRAIVFNQTSSSSPKIQESSKPL